MAAAIPEMRLAMISDPTQADILGMLVACERAVGQEDLAQAHYRWFKYIAKRSLALEWMQEAKATQ